MKGEGTNLYLIFRKLRNEKVREGSNKYQPFFNTGVKSPSPKKPPTKNEV